jgi:hypothetical protein
MPNLESFVEKSNRINSNLRKAADLVRTSEDERVLMEEIGKTMAMYKTILEELKMDALEADNVSRINASLVLFNKK